MKALVQTRYGPPDVLEVQDADEPQVNDNEILIAVRAASVNPADWHFMRGEPYIARLQSGLRAPKAPVLGCDVAGSVERVGPGVTAFQEGEAVFGCTFMRGFGAFAERVALPAEVALRTPADLSFAQAAALPLAGLTALQGLRDHATVEKGNSVLIVGASGGVGTFAVQIAKALGAEVTGVCSTKNVDFVRSLGADNVIDYTSQDFTEAGERFDSILQLAGKHSALQLRNALTSDGKAVLISGDSDGRWFGAVGRVISAKLFSPFVREELTSFTVEAKREDLTALAELVESGQVEPHIDRTFSLHAAPDAVRYVEDGQPRGKVVINMGCD